MKKLLVVCSSLLVICLLIFLVVSFVVPKTTLSDQEEKKAVEQILGRKEREITPTSTATQHNAPDFTLTLPPGAKEYTFAQDQVEQSANYLSGIRFQGFSPAYFFVVRVEKREANTSYDDVSAVRLRRLQKDTYQESAIQIDHHEAILFEKQDPDAEKSAFLLTPGKVYSFAISGNQLSILDDIFTQVMASVHVQ